MPKKKLSRQERHDAELFAQAMTKAMLALRAIAGAYPVCPRCYAEAIIGQLEQLIEEGLDHGKALSPLTPALFSVDTIGETEGNA